MRSACLATLVCAAPLAVAGTVTGRVELIDKGGRRAPDLSEVVVYLHGVKGPARPARATMVMKGKEFRPHVVAVGVGSTVEFPNEDGIFHNAFSVSGVNRFDLDLYKKPKTGKWTFQHPGVVRVYCNIHPQMSAVVLVVDNSFFTSPAASGAFTLEDVPEGRYGVRAWHERAGEVAAEVQVPAEGTASVARLVLDASSFKRVPHKNKFGKDYAAPEKY